MKKRLVSYLLRHVQVLLATLGQFIRSPLPTLLTAAVLGIALALPMGLFVLVDNLTQATAHWHEQPQISLFLRSGVDSGIARQMAADIRERDDVADVNFLSAEAALDDFKKHSGFGLALDALTDNPLPSVLIVVPGSQTRDPAAISRLAAELSDLPRVDVAQLDLEWVQRLYAVLALAKRSIAVLAVVLGLGVVLIISNTTRLAVLNRREEIEVIDRIGGTAAFVRRPFLYAGFLHGVLGAIFAWVVVGVGITLLAGPIADLAVLYGSAFALDGVSWRLVLLLLTVGGGLGWVASRITVAHQLRRLHPV